MRVLLAAYAARSHFTAMVPLGQALVAAGHQVRVASQPALAGAITGTGLTAVPVGRDHAVSRMLEFRPEIAGRLRTMGMPPFDLAQGPTEAVTWEALTAGYEGFAVPWLFRLVNEPMLAELVDFCRAWRPDLVVWEPITLAAPVAASVVGAAHARLLWSVDLFGHLRDRFVRLRDARPAGDRRDALAELLDRWARRYGGAFGEEMLSGRVTIDQLPPSMRLAGGPDSLPMRYVPYNGTAVVPRWLWDRPERPRVCLTLGVTDGELYGGSLLPISELLSALADLDAEIVATLPGAGRDASRRPLPDNVRVTGYVPLHALATASDAVVHHAGWGTVCTTAHSGVPQLAIAQREFDGPLLARGVAAQGAGLVLDPGELDGDVLRRAVGRLLADPSFREGAAGLREEMLAMPSPAEVAARLAEL
ncbi:activator-dependent family glycosyltransferase [Sphaerisporangium dianthi]|uniref:Activator-dependent family glycosyltransferase n=1 Tax=Sphaerisporangium dianthi TaxID=1436120 RepID=A0ABV9CS41_9ACTN